MLLHTEWQIGIFNSVLKKISKSEDEWRDILTPEQFRIMRLRKTEPPFSGEYLEIDEKGVYRCAACGNMLFSSDAKYDSGTGWPSFFSAIDEGHVELGIYSPHGTEVMCAVCGAHLGHVFEDGPEMTGKRYCINSTVLKLDKTAKEPARKSVGEEYYGTPG